MVAEALGIPRQRAARILREWGRCLGADEFGPKYRRTYNYQVIDALRVFLGQTDDPEVDWFAAYKKDTP